MSQIVVITMIAFMVLEFSNVIALYSKPDFKYANAVGMFKTWKKSQEDPEMRDFAKYLVNWVANTKLIFILLLIVILIWGDETTQLYACLALVLSIAMYYWKLHPIIRRMDKNGHIEPKNYSLILFAMITVFMAALLTAFIVGWIQ